MKVEIPPVDLVLLLPFGKDDFEYRVEQRTKEAENDLIIGRSTNCRIQDPDEKNEPTDSYFPDIDLQGDEITTALEYSSWNVDRGRIDEETSSYAEDYFAENTLPTDQNLVIRYRYIFVTKERTFLDYQLVYVQ